MVVTVVMVVISEQSRHCSPKNYLIGQSKKVLTELSSFFSSKTSLFSIPDLLSVPNIIWHINNKGIKVHAEGATHKSEWSTN